MAFKFPFTNYHELNLTWVLDQLKSLFEKSEENVTVIENYNGRLTAVETELPLVEETAQGAAQQAAAAATLAQQAKSTADTAQENAIQAQGLAGTARQEAQAAQTAADAATQAAQQAQATAQNFDGRITQAENNAASALEASRSFENRVQAAITTANNAAQTATNAQGIATRADQNAALALDTLNAQRSELERIGREQAALISEETESGKTEIENLAQSVLDSIPADYTALSALVDKKAPVIINSASGAVASFNDGADNMKIQKLVVNIEPVQAGSGDPSPDNVRPISGWTGAEIKQAGNNVFGGEALADFIVSNVQGAVKNPQNKTVTYEARYIQNVIIYDRFKENTLYTVILKGAPNTFSNMGFDYGNGIQAFAQFDSDGWIVKVSDTGKNIEALAGVWSSGTTTLYYEQCGILEGAVTLDDFVPYPNDIITATFPAGSVPVYGGSFALYPDSTGTLMVDMAIVDMGTLNWVYQDNKYFRAPFPNGAEISGYGSNDFLCEIYRYGTGPDIFNQTADKVMTLNSSYLVGQAKFACVRDSTYTDAASFKAAMSGVQLCYPLVSPQTYTLPAEQVSGILTTLYGQNNIWADAGPVSVDYPADTKLYIDGKLAELQATILENI